MEIVIIVFAAFFVFLIIFILCCVFAIKKLKSHQNTQGNTNPPPTGSYPRQHPNASAFTPHGDGGFQQSTPWITPVHASAGNSFNPAPPLPPGTDFITQSGGYPQVPSGSVPPLQYGNPPPNAPPPQYNGPADYSSLNPHQQLPPTGRW